MTPNSKYTVELVDYEYYQRQISCQTACPVRTDARGYVNAIVDGDYEAGYVRARQPNPFASTCGRVCAAHCEKACRRGKLDAPVTIRALKRFLCEPREDQGLSRLSISKGIPRTTGNLPLTGEAPRNTRTAESYSQLSRETRRATPAVKVAVIGSGPAGLTAAHDLSVLGHQVTIFEAAPAPGGMAILGIPKYRLPRSIIQLEIGEIVNLGVELKLNTRLGTDFSLASLKEEGFKAAFIAIGAHQDRSLDIEGVHLDGVISAVEFLLNANLGYRVELGERVIVVGGGDVAIDAARMAARLGEAYGLLASGDLVTAADAARYALRMGVRTVHIVYRGTRQEMRASQDELEGALEEGSILHNGLIPNRIVSRGGRVAGLETLTARSRYDDTGRRTLLAVPGSEAIIECDSVIMAIGQQGDLSFIQPGDGIEVTPQGTIIADSESLATTAPGIFAGGDVVYGPRTIIEAVADGHKAARAMDNYLRAGQVQTVCRGWMEEVPRDYLPDTEQRSRPRSNPAKIPLDRRTGISEVETVYDEASAREQAGRCLKCHVQTVFNQDLCIMCGGCVDICPNSCLKLVPVEEIAGPGELTALIKTRYGVTDWPRSAAGETESLGTAMIKDETKCIRCGLCARRCPVGAITMEAFWFEEQLTDAGAPR